MDKTGLEGMGIIALLLAQIVLRLVDQKKMNNGGNPVVKAIDRLEGVLKESLNLYGAQMSKHEDREEAKWDKVSDKLDAERIAVATAAAAAAAAAAVVLRAKDKT